MSGKVALVFAGQGAQFVGMGKDFAEKYPECAELFSKADEILGRDLSRICFEGPIEDLTRSDNCQPAIFAASMAAYTALRLEAGDLGFAAAAGLSLGEWSALHAAGALSFEDTLKVLEARGRYMQEACEERQGAMACVIGLKKNQLEEICENTGAQIANLNSPVQTVLSGESECVEKAAGMAEEAGAKRVIMLKVAGAFHSGLMTPAAEKLGRFLEDIKISKPAIPVVANVSGKPHGDPGGIAAQMVRQVNSTINWVSCAEWFKNAGFKTYVECGPGKVVSGLIKSIDREASLNNIQDMASLETALSSLLTARN